MYPCIHPCIHASMHPHIHTSIHSDIHPSIHACIYIYIYHYIIISRILDLRSMRVQSLSIQLNDSHNASVNNIQFHIDPKSSNFKASGLLRRCYKISFGIGMVNSQCVSSTPHYCSWLHRLELSACCRLKWITFSKTCNTLYANPHTKSQRFSSRATKWCYRGSISFHWGRSTVDITMELRGRGVNIG